MFRDIVSWIYPTYCLWCQITGQWYVCKACHRSLKSHPELCPICHKHSVDYQVCLDCRLHTPLHGMIIWFCYHDIIKKAVLKIKYHHVYDLANFFAHKLHLLIQTNATLRSNIAHSTNTIITYVPSHRTRKYFVKWYNQSELLAQSLALLSWYPCISLISKIKRTQSQAKLNRSQRLSNLIGAFRINTHVELSGQETVIIVDDVTTTGSTITELAQHIHAWYPQTSIWWLVVARNS